MNAQARVLGSLGAIVIAGALTVAVAAPAAADIPSTITFSDPAPVEASFGSDWVIPLSLVGSMYEGSGTAPLTPEDGAVNLTLSGIAGVYAVAVPIQPGGVAYFSQPTDQPLLAPGSYQVSAAFVPIAGSYFDASTTFAPLQLTITELALVPRVSAEYEPGADQPVITARLEGEYVDQSGGAPAGVWSFVVTDQHKTQVFDAEVAQAAGAEDPLRIEITSKLSSGYDYTVTSTFTTVEELSSGIAVNDIAAAKFSAPSGTLVEMLGGAAPVPLRLAIPLGILILALAVTAIVLAIKLRDSAPEAPPRTTDDADGSSAVEIVDMEFVGIEPLHDGPANWSLSDDTEPVSRDDDSSSDNAHYVK